MSDPDSQKRAVVCEDNSAYQRILSHVLEKLGYTVSSAFNGQEGVEALKQGPCALLILDLEMPAKDGLSVLEDMKALPGPRPYVLVLSAHEGADLHGQVRALGADDVMVKPFNPAEFQKKVAALKAQGRA